MNSLVPAGVASADVEVGGERVMGGGGGKVVVVEGGREAKEEDGVALAWSWRAMAAGGGTVAGRAEGGMDPE